MNGQQSFAKEGLEILCQYEELMPLESDMMVGMVQAMYCNISLTLLYVRSKHSEAQKYTPL